MARITADMLPDEPAPPVIDRVRARLPRPQLPPAPAALQAAFIIGAAHIGAEAEQGALRWLAIVAIGVAVYIIGARDGRRDLALDLLVDRRNDPATGRPPDRGQVIPESDPE